MFISQVLFESESKNEEKLLSIMKRKMQQSENSKGLISSECWRKEGEGTVGYSFVNKWIDKESFRQWMKESHAVPHTHDRKQSDSLTITKTAFQYESVDLSCNCEEKTIDTSRNH